MLWTATLGMLLANTKQLNAMPVPICCWFLLWYCPLFSYCHFDIIELSNNKISVAVSIVKTYLIGALAVIITSLLTFDRTLFHSVCSLLYGAATIVTAFSVNKVSKSKKKFFFKSLKDCRFNADKIKLIIIGNNMSNLRSVLFKSHYWKTVFV